MAQLALMLIFLHFMVKVLEKVLMEYSSRIYAKVSDHIICHRSLIVTAYFLDNIKNMTKSKKRAKRERLREQGVLHNYLCETCNPTVGFRRKEEKRRHWKKEHITKSPPPPPPPPLICKTCNKEFKTKKTLQRHMRNMHKRKKQWTCSGCRKFFSTKFNSKRHENTCKDCK